MSELTMGSLFDGIGGFPLAAVRNGITPLWASEIEPFPIEVTKTHFPDMTHVGDITKLNGADLPPVDIICGGQSVSGPLDRELHPRRFARRKIGTFYGADSADKGDERCRHTSRANRQACSPQILLLGECPRLLQLRLVARGGFPDCPGGNC